MRYAPWIALAPISYVLTSIAAWCGLFELFRKPHHWHKTALGEARLGGGLGRLQDSA